MSVNNFKIKVFSDEDVLCSHEKFGRNEWRFKKENGVFKAFKSIAREPMILLLFLASLIYFISGEMGDGIFLLSAILIVSAISLYQNTKSRNTLLKLKDFTQATSLVNRNGATLQIEREFGHWRQPHC